MGSLRMRAVTSVPPPAGNGTIMVIGRDGNGWADAASMPTNVATNATAENKFFTLPPANQLGRGRRRSSLRQSRLAQPINIMVNILGVLEDGETFPAFNCEARVDPQHLRGLFPGLLKFSQLGVGSREPKVGQLYIRSARREFPQQTHRVPIALEHVTGLAHPTCRVHMRL